MIKTEVCFSELSKHNLKLDPEFYVQYKELKKKYEYFLNKKCKNNKKVPFNKAVLISSPKEIQKGGLVIKPSSQGKLIFDISKVNCENKFSSIVVIPKKEQSFSSQYILWFLSQEAITNYISLLSSGSMIPRISKQDLEELSFPLPLKGQKVPNSQNSFTIQTRSPVRELLMSYHMAYKSNVDKGEYLTASILAGAICEAVIYELLIDDGVQEKLLNGQTLGTLIKYLLLRQIEDYDKFISHFEKIQELRNDAVHVSRAIEKDVINNFDKIKDELVVSMDNVIKYFGI